VFQRCVSAILALAIIIVDAIVVFVARKNVGAQFAAILMTVFNVFIPNVCKWISFAEKHSTEEGWQTSLYFKITIFRWINTVIIFIVITPFTRYLTGGEKDLLPSIGGVFVAELLLTPALGYLNLWPSIQKVSAELRLFDSMKNTVLYLGEIHLCFPFNPHQHYFAPRSRTQEEMNLCFQGNFVMLAERYTVRHVIVINKNGDMCNHLANKFP